MNKRRIIIQCANCNKDVELRPSEIKAGRKNCSGKCGGINRWKNPIFREYLVKKWKGRIPSNLKFLIANAKENHGYREKQLGKSYPWMANRKGVPSPRKGKHYPEMCGKNNPAWIADRTQLKKRNERNDSMYQDWRKQVIKRDDSICKLQNENCLGYKIVHHILPWKDYPEERYNINNGITLCQYHHPRRREDEKELILTFQDLIGLNINFNGK